MPTNKRAVHNQDLTALECTWECSCCGTGVTSDALTQVLIAASEDEPERPTELCPECLDEARATGVVVEVLEPETSR